MFRYPMMPMQPSRNQIFFEALRLNHGATMPRRRKVKLPPRIALPAAELESKIMAMLRGLRECAKLRCVGFVHVGSFGQEPNWFARPLANRISEACRQAFVTALTKRKEFDLLFRQRTEQTSRRAATSPAEPITKAAGSRISAEQGTR